RTGIPFFTTQMGKGVVDETHPAWLGNASLSSGDFVHRAIESADCILNVGHDVVEKPPFVMRPGPTVIHVGFSSAEVDGVYHPQIEVVGDIANAVWRITEALSPQSHWELEAFGRYRTALDAHVARGTDDDRFPLHPARLVTEVRRAMPDDGI